jgi:prepilin-type processing-associated H-X9-DG protein
MTACVAERYGACNVAKGILAGSVRRGGVMWARWDWADLWQPVFAADFGGVGDAAMFQSNLGSSYVYPSACNPLVSQTPHAGGVNTVAFLDGSVRAVAGGIAPAVWWAVLTPRGGEDIRLD